MRIQHNIMTMSAYRNYTNNVSAMKKNLEKLSSGYKINRAGDDAAGLAISEKMRAQITGLETAQKNAKDGISLVQTAEGALTEVHDMLNRMVELATQSANGTYDNETDRYQLQKEVNQLLDEINRIADSSNFNGINLLDGSMDSSAITGVTYTDKTADEVKALFQETDWTGKTQLDVDGGKGVLETESVAASKAGFQISLDNIGTIEGNQAFNLKIGTETTSVTLDAGTYTASTLASAVADKLTSGLTYDGATYKVTADGNTLKFESDDKVELDTSAIISWYTGDEEPDPTDVSVKYTVDMSAFTGTNAPADGDTITVAGQDFTYATDLKTTLDGQSVTDADGKTLTLEFDDTTNVLTIINDAGDIVTDPTVSVTPAGNETTVTAEAGATTGVAGTKSTIEGTLTIANAAETTGDNAGKFAVTLGGNIVGYVSANDKFGDAFALLNAPAGYSAVTTPTDGGTGAFKFEADEVGEKAATSPITGATYNKGSNGTKAKADYDLSAFVAEGKGSITVGTETVNWDTDLATTLGQLTGYNVTVNGDTATIEKKTASAGAMDAVKWSDATATNVDVSKVEKAKTGYINTGMQNPTSFNDGGSALVARGSVDFSDAWSDGSKIKIGDTTYTVAVGADSKFKNASNVVDLTDQTGTPSATIAAERLAAAAKDNATFTVGHDGTGITTLQQKTSVKESTDMSTVDKFASYLGVSVADTESLENAKAGRGLTLQIGDTAASYNQLTVDIKDMHAASLGIDGLSIADQDSAAAAIDKIKAAINAVSDVRGTLGATQNRLDHTINNLSVMTENIQDAESTIRDVDVAEEMMAYTKNNILIQSAQAMLAQANQVPQGVLQLLQ